MQARQAGNHISGILEQAKLDYEIRNGETKRRRFRVVIHTSPFLRCIQTSVGIASGLAQTASDSIYQPSDIIVPPNGAPTPTKSGKPNAKSATLRVDSFLGEWLSPEYFNHITPPPGAALMLGGAKAELLRREDYSPYDTEFEPSKPQPALGRSNSLWQSPNLDPKADDAGVMKLASLANALPRQPEKKKGYVPPRPISAVLGGGKIPQGYISHARDTCVDVDYQWDSMRLPLDFGDGGVYGEEWTSMHKRFRRGIRKLLNWYATNEPSISPTSALHSSDGSAVVDGNDAREDEEVETVVILVSHGAGCNAMMGAITHQPVLMDVSIASITLAERRPELNYGQLLSVAPVHELDSTPRVGVDQMYEIRMSASTEHLRSGSRSSTPPSRSGLASRGRTSTFSSSGGPVMNPFMYSDTWASAGYRSVSASASVGPMLRRESLKGRRKQSGGVEGSGNTSPSTTATSSGLWSPAPSTLRVLDDHSEESEDEYYRMMPDFDQTRFKIGTDSKKPSLVNALPSPALTNNNISPFPSPSLAGYAGPMLAGPIKLNTDFGLASPPAEEVAVTQLGGGLGGLWGQPPPPSDGDRMRDLSHSKRRWTVNATAK